MDILAPLASALKARSPLVMFCRCSIDYDGRAQSVLPEGDRIILIKKDGTLLVHQPIGSTPVNYMMGGATHRVEKLSDGSVLLRSSGKKEHMAITILDAYHLHSQSLTDNGKIAVLGTEKDMSDMLYANPHLIGADFTPLSREEHTKYGYVDVLGHDGDRNIVVVECKRTMADPKAVEQLRRYVERMKKDKGTKNVRGILACPQLSPKGTAMLLDYGLEHVRIEPPRSFEKEKGLQKGLGDY